MKKKSLLVISLALLLSLVGCQEESSASTSILDSTEISAPTSISEQKSDEPIYRVGGVAQKRTFATFEANRKEKENKRTEFKNREDVYKVATQGKFNFKPILDIVTETGDPVGDIEWEFEVQLEEKTGEIYQVVNMANEYVESLDTTSCDITFKESAVGKTFKITVTPKGLTDRQLENISRFQTSIEFEVVDGLNIYNDLGLSYLNNQVEGRHAEGWASFRETHGIDTTISPTKIIFHDNIFLTVDSFPSTYIYQESDLNPSDSDYERALGSLIDYEYIYQYDFKDDTSEESIGVFGNYFNLDCSTLPFVVREDKKITQEGRVMSHSALFYDYVETLENGQYKTTTFENINFIGNAPRVEDTLKSGGIILQKSNTKTIIDNVIATAWFIPFFNNGSTTEYRITSSRAYDSFNCLFYSWGGTDTVIENSELIGAGGPVIIQDHVRPTSSDGRVSSTHLVNSYAESFVAGTEGWFDLVGAAAVAPSIKSFSNAFSPFGRTFVKVKEEGNQSVTLMNLISVTKSGSAQGLSNETIKGRIKFDDLPSFDYGTFDENSSPYFNAFLSGFSSMGAPVFQSSTENGWAGFSPDVGLITLDQSMNVTPITSPSHPIFSGDYLALYYSGMMMSFGYYNV